MTRICRNIRRGITYANVVATLALMFALGGTAAAAVLITSNGQVGQNTISGHQPPSGRHANLIGGSINGTDLAGTVKSSFTVHCPTGLQRGGDVCFDSTPRAAAAWDTALANCARANLRLPSAAELAKVFNNVGAPQNPHWTDDAFYSGGDAAYYEYNHSDRTLVAGTDYWTDLLQYRCVAAPTN